mmetsp:Transcript_34285/g.63954  ORF Transcript_34285/g.63954 Transcript_34285/m.63954 type:complete len:120 (-) Transcript_34285:165-524(-)
MAAFGTEQVGALPQVAERVNHAFFKQMANGSSVRLGGRLATSATGSGLQLTTTDGGVVTVSGLPDPTNTALGFVEVVGKKASSSEIDAVGWTPLGEQVDAELWEEAMKMVRLPQLRAFF